MVNSSTAGLALACCASSEDESISQSSENPTASGVVLEAESEATVVQSDVEQLPTYLEPLNASLPSNTSLSANGTEDIISASNATEKYAKCLELNGTSEVMLVNDTELMSILTHNPNITAKDEAAPCCLILFYSKYCPFSSMAAPHFNALPRAFPDVRMLAINAMLYHIFNAQNGVIGVPTLALFHNGRPVAKFNDSEYTLELFSQFIERHTGIKAKDKSFVTSADFRGPVSSVPAKETDVLLGLAWLFIGVCAVYYFTKSKYWTWIVETAQNTWRESEAQHEHVE